mgnify:FL=1
MKKHILLVLFALLPLALLTGGCHSSYGTRKQKEVARIQEERKKEAVKQYNEAVRRHQSIQTKETRKRMKMNEREASRKSKGKKVFFLKRWFSKKY